VCRAGFKYRASINLKIKFLDSSADFKNITIGSASCDNLVMVKNNVCILYIMVKTMETQAMIPIHDPLKRIPAPTALPVLVPPPSEPLVGVGHVDDCDSVVPISAVLGCNVMAGL
jgi:hypothetical protein